MDYHHLLYLTPILAILIHLVLKRLTRSELKTPPEAEGGWPFIGHLRLFKGREPVHIKLGAMADKYGPIFTVRFGVRRYVVVSSRGIAKELFTTHDLAVSSRPQFAAGRLLNYDNTAFGFSPYNKYWREMRKFVAMELLSNRRLNMLKPIKSDVLESSVKQLYQMWTKSEGAAVEMNQWVGDLNLNLMLRLVSGGGGSEAQQQRVRETVREFFRASGLMTVGDFLPFLRWLDLDGYEKEMKKAAADMDRVAAEWVEEHRRKSLEVDHEADFTDVLLPALQQMDLGGHHLDTVAKATLITLLAGGTETITISITWTLALLVNNPETLEKAVSELEQHVGRDKCAITESDLENLVYLQAVVKESLRLHPAGPVAIMRVFTQACTLGAAGYHIPKGTELMVNIWKLQTDPTIWSDPLKFRPERFLDLKDVDVRGQHFELIPFGAGRRACPGITIGVQMTLFVVASLLHAFKITNPTVAPIDMTSSQNLTNNKDSLQLLLYPRLPTHFYL